MMFTSFAHIPEEILWYVHLELGIFGAENFAYHSVPENKFR